MYKLALKFMYVLTEKEIVLLYARQIETRQ